MHPTAGGTDSPSDLAADPRHWARLRQARSRRVLAVSMAVSALLHVVALLFYPSVERRWTPEVRHPFAPLAPSAQGIDVIRLLELASVFTEDEPEEPTEIEQLESPREVPGALVLTDPGLGELAPPPLTGAERLRPRFTNPRLWVIEDPTFSDLSMEQREELIVAGRLEAWYDSVTAAAAAEAALTDWTFTDAEGKKWGFSPGKIHLGDVTLPLPFGFGTAVGKRDEVARRTWEWEEITRQGARADVEQSWRERSEAIRARRDRERGVQPDSLDYRR